MASKKPKRRRVAGRKPGSQTGRGSQTNTDPGAGAGQALDTGATGAEEVAGSLGLVEPGGVAVEVDRAALLAEADAIAGAAPPVVDPAAPISPPLEGPAAAPAPSPQEAASLLVLPATFITGAVLNWAAPNWRVTREEAAEVGEAGALAWAYWFPPGANDPKYAALMMLGAALWNLAESRKDPETGKYRPLRVKPAKIDQATPPAATGETITL